MPVSTLLREAASSLLGTAISTIVPTALTSGGSSASGPGYTTASVSIANGETAFLMAAATAGTTIGTCTPVLSGVTWTELANSDLTQPRGFSVFKGVGSGSGTIALNWTGSVGLGSCSWVIGKATGLDASTPIVHQQVLRSALNANTVTIYSRKFRDPTYNVSLLCGMCGYSAADPVEGAGYTNIGSTHASAANGLIMEYKVGEDLTADFSWGGTAVSNLGVVLELQASGAAALAPLSFVEIGKGGSTSGATTYSYTTLTGAAPVYASAHPIYLAVYNTRSGSTVVVPTASGGGVTWVQVATKTFNSSQDCLTVFRAMGPLNGTDVTIPVTSAHTGCHVWMAAPVGANLTGTNGSGSVVQAVSASASTTAVASATLAANANANNGVMGFFAISSQGGGSTIRTIPGDGMVTVSPFQNTTGEPISGSPNQRMFVAAMPYNSTSVSATFGGTGETAAIGIEVAAA